MATPSSLFTLSSQLSGMKEHLKPVRFQVTGFDFIEDTQDSVYDEVLPKERGMCIPEGFMLEDDGKLYENLS